MFQILVADDERITRRGIVTILERGLKEDISFIEASNGAEALQIVQTQSIDLAITDIRMPICSGLEFVEKLRALNSDMTVVIVSGFEDFSYAQQALRLGVRDYVTKPIQKENFLSLIENCIAELERKKLEMMEQVRRANLHKKFLDEVKREAFLSLLRGENLSANVVRLKSLDFEFSAPFFLATVLEFQPESNFSEEIDLAVGNMLEEYFLARAKNKMFSVNLRRGALAVVFEVFKLEEVKNFRKQLAGAILKLKDYFRTRFIFGLGEVVFSLNDLQKSFAQALTAADYKIFNTNQFVVEYANIHVENISLPQSNFDSEVELLRRLDKIFQAQRDEQTLAELKKIYETLCEKFRRQQKNFPAQENYPVKNFSELWNVFDLRRECRQMFQLLESWRGHEHDDKNFLAEAILEFTRRHATEDIDLNFIADKFSKTPGYIGALFRQKYSQGFNDFINRERINLALNLLKDPSLSVQEVSHRCGYYNTKYFSVVFKKIVGVSPKAYQLRGKN